MTTGYVLWEGPSQLDFKTPIVCILTTHSKNTKTGDMMQTWVLRQDIAPHEAVRRKLDGPICGDCIHASTQFGSCYVQVWQAPYQIWNQWRAGKYPAFELRTHKRRLARRALRICAYGDPAAVPVSIWAMLTPHVRLITGYTHQWRTHPHLAPYCMASVESLAERAAAKTLGFRTFRVTDTKKRLIGEEALCPATKEAGKKLTCIQCGHCNGTQTGLTGDVTAPIHGIHAKRYRESMWTSK